MYPQFFFPFSTLLYIFDTRNKIFVFSKYCPLFSCHRQYSLLLLIYSAICWFAFKFFIQSLKKSFFLIWKHTDEISAYLYQCFIFNEYFTFKIEKKVYLGSLKYQDSFSFLTPEIWVTF